MSRKDIYDIIGKSENSTNWGRAYDIFMMLVILASIAPLTTHTTGPIFNIIDKVCCGIFIVDYLLRWMTADLREGKKGIMVFLRYPFTAMAIVDLLTILPSISSINEAFKVLRISRLSRVLRVARFFRYYEPLHVMVKVIRKQRKTLMSVLIFAIFYILVCALVMFNVEDYPFFDTFFDAVYWACCTLTTVGYGDIYPTTTIGRVVSMVSAMVGIAIIALPSGIVTSGYLDELRAQRVAKKRKDQKDEDQD